MRNLCKAEKLGWGWWLGIFGVLPLNSTNKIISELSSHPPFKLFLPIVPSFRGGAEWPLSPPCPRPGKPFSHPKVSNRLSRGIRANHGPDRLTYVALEYGVSLPFSSFNIVFHLTGHDCLTSYVDYHVMFFSFSNFPVKNEHILGGGEKLEP